MCFSEYESMWLHVLEFLFLMIWCVHPFQCGWIYVFREGKKIRLSVLERSWKINATELETTRTFSKEERSNGRQVSSNRGQFTKKYKKKASEEEIFPAS